MNTIKKSIVALVAIFAFSFAANAQSTNDQALIGKAREAAKECLQPYNGSYEITASVEVTGICFVEGYTYKVTFAAGPKCSGTGPCPAFATILVATVYFDCDGNVISSECTN